MNYIKKLNKYKSKIKSLIGGGKVFSNFTIDYIADRTPIFGHYEYEQMFDHHIGELIEEYYSYILSDLKTRWYCYVNYDSVNGMLYMTEPVVSQIETAANLTTELTFINNYNNIHNYVNIYLSNNINYFLSAHGCLLSEDYVIPDRVSIIMFCKNTKIGVSNKRLIESCSYMRNAPKYNHIKFVEMLKNADEYQHYCICYANEVINNMEFEHDDEIFLTGLFELPTRINHQDGQDIDMISCAEKCDSQYLLIASNPKDVVITSNYFKFPDGIKLNELVDILLNTYPPEMYITLLISACRDKCNTSEYFVYRSQGKPIR